MTRYVALFSRINVGGNRLAMADLRQALEREDFEAVETVVASGNVLFSHEERPSAGLAEKLAYILEDRFDIACFAAVLTRAELAAALAANPFAEDGEEQQVHVLFCDAPPEAAGFERLVADYAGKGPERMALGDGLVYVDYCDGVGRSKLTTAFLEKRLGCSVTARNIRSLTRILEKMEG